MADASTSDSNTPEESLGVPVGGNALNPQGEATHNPDKLGAGEEGDALDNDEIEENADELNE